MWYIIDGKDLKPEDQLVSVKDLNTRIAELEVEVSNDYVAKEEGKGLSSNDYTYNEKTKLSGIEDDAEVNVQADWNESDSTADSFIKNKPSIPTVPTNVSSFTNDSGYLVSNDLKTINSQSIVGSGDLDIEPCLIGDISNLTTSSTMQQIYKAFGSQETYNKFLDCIQEGIPVYMYKSSSFGPGGSGRSVNFIPIIKTAYNKSPMSSSGTFTVIFPASALDSSAVVSFGIKRFSFDSTGPIVTASSYSDNVRKTYMINYGIDALTSNSTSSDISSVINLKEILDLTQSDGNLNYFSLNYKFIDNSYAPASLYNIIGLFVESWSHRSDYRYIIQYMKGADKLVTLTLSSDTNGTENSYTFVSKTEVDLSNSAGSLVDVQINGTSIVSNNEANILTNTAYNSLTNKIATMSDITSAIGTALNQSY